MALVSLNKDFGPHFIFKLDKLVHVLQIGNNPTSWDN